MFEAIFYCSESGNEPVREWLKTLPKAARKIVGSDIDLVQRCFPIGKPLVDSVGRGMWEIRSRLSNTIARVIFITDRNTIILLHGFMKKTQKTPPQELVVAEKRMKQYTRRRS